MLSDVAGMHMTADVQVPARRQTVSALRLRNAASIAALTLVLAGCGGEATEGETEPSEEVTASDPGAQAGAEEEPDDEASETNDEDSDSSDDGADSNEPVPASSDGPAENWPEPEKPDAMFEETEEGAVAALEYWVELREYARNTGDTASLNTISSETCESCSGAIDAIEAVYAEDKWIEQSPDVLNDITTEQEDDRVFIEFELEEGSFIIHSTNGPESVDEQQTRYLFDSELFFDGQEWQVQELWIVEEAIE